MDVAEHLTQLCLTPLEVRYGESLQVLDDLAVDHDTGVDVACGEPGIDECDGAWTPAQECVQDAGVEEIAAHASGSSCSPGRSSMSGVGGTSRRQRSSVSSMSAGRSAQTPARRRARAPRGSTRPA